MSNYEERQDPCKIPRNHPIRWIMRDICNLPDQPYNPDDPELMLIHYDELVEILERHIGATAVASQESS